ERVVSGYTGGRGPASYREVCSGRTGHAEAIQVTFDPTVLSYAEVLEVFFAFHDPTTQNRQRPGVRSQDPSAVVFHSPEQERSARAAIARLEADGVFPAPIVTEVVPLTTFYPAEDYHQGYYRQNPEQPYCRAMIAPKVAKLRAKYSSRLREEPAGR